MITKILKAMTLFNKNFNFKKTKAFSLIELSIVVLIIGILIAGVTQGSRLVRQSKIKSAQNLTQSSNVASIPDLAMWLETSLDTAVTSASNGASPEDGDKVSSWNDNNPQNTTKLNATQAISANQPTYLVSAINNLPTLFFNYGTYSLSATPPINPNSRGYTIITVSQMNDSNNGAMINQSLLIQGPSSGTCDGRYIGLNFVYTKPIVWGCGGGVDWTTSSATLSFKTPYIEIVKMDFTKSSNLSFYLNQKNPTLVSMPASSSTYQVANDVFSIGIFNGYISEIIIYNRSLKSSEIQDIQDYLAKKYKITLS